MALTLLLGGARSGKSTLALQLAAAQLHPVVFIATGEPLDDEMAARIEQHRAERPREWTTVEAPVDLVGAITSAPQDSCLVVDCLTLWVSNIRDRPDDDVLAESERGARAAARRRGRVIAVSNEVGTGVVPFDAEVRRYRDLLGRVNAGWASEAETAVLVVAGRVLPLQPPDGLVTP